jgi:hypothetical protein
MGDSGRADTHTIAPGGCENESAGCACLGHVRVGNVSVFTRGRVRRAWAVVKREQTISIFDLPGKGVEFGLSTKESEVPFTGSDRNHLKLS